MIRIIIFLFIVNFAWAQDDWVGTWYGKLSIQGQELRVNFHLSLEKGLWKGVLDSPDQAAFGIPATKVEVKKDKLIFEVQNIGVQFIGEKK